MSNKPSKKDDKDKVPIIVKNATDLQRLKLEKLMKNPDKPVVIPEAPRQKSLASAPDFVRNVMGSSAGAGSGEFHVYRHLRRKEYARQKFIHDKCETDKLNDEYHQKIADNKKIAEEKTAKKRAKRMKKKFKAKKLKLNSQPIPASPSNSSDNDSDVKSDLKKTDDDDKKNIDSSDTDTKHSSLCTITSVESSQEKD